MILKFHISEFGDINDILNMLPRGILEQGSQSLPRASTTLSASVGSSSLTSGIDNSALNSSSPYASTMVGAVDAETTSNIGQYKGIIFFHSI